MIILGIDPGLKATGYGFINFEKNKTKLLEAGSVEPKQSDLIQNRIFKIYTILIQLVDQYQPNVLVLEKLYAHYKHPTTASILGHIRGVICLIAAQKRLELIEHSVKRIRKAVTGNGNASKVQTQKVIVDALNIKARNLTLDASDALALALGYIHINKRVI